MPDAFNPPSKKLVVEYQLFEAQKNNLVGGKMSVLFMSDVLIKVDTGMVELEAWLLTDFAAHNGHRD